MPLNEAETRFEKIDPVLRDKGYRLPYIRLETPAPVEPVGAKGRRRPGPGKTDYLLCVELPSGTKPLPVAILEAKREGEDPLKGMQQAKGYAECERFEAKYIFSTNGDLYAKFNKFTYETTGPFPFSDFPDQQRLTDCYHRQTAIKLDEPAASMFFQPDSPAYPESRYSAERAAKAEVVSLKEKLKALKAANGKDEKIEALEAKIAEQERAAREAKAKADAIDAAVFDLKAVNPNAVVRIDTRTPEQVIESIAEQGRIVATALETLRGLLSS
jgi:hypothetical protein